MIFIENAEQYKHKNAYYGVVKNENGQINVFVSYNTIIAASYNGVTFLTSRSYSNTTAHHKTDAERFYNNAKTIIVDPSTLIELVENPSISADIITDYKKFIAIKAEIENGTASLYKLQKDGVLFNLNNKGRETESKKYKNGNYKEIYRYYLTTEYFNLNLKVTKHFFKFKTGCKVWKHGKQEPVTGYRIKQKVIILY